MLSTTQTLKENQDQIRLGTFLPVFCSYHSHRFGVSRGPSEGSDQSNETNVDDLDSMRSWNKTAGRAMWWPAGGLQCAAAQTPPTAQAESNSHLTATMTGVIKVR